MQDRKLLRLTDGGISVFADLSDIARGDLNDLVVDERGWVYVGNFGYDSLGGAPKALTDLHVVEPDGTIHIAAGGLEFPNGMVIINEGRTLVVAETWACRLTAFDRDAEGRLSNRRIFADLKTREPDGICVDASDAIWVASFNTGEFIRVLDGGQVTDQLRCGEHAISCAIGGEDGKTLFCSVFDGDLDAMLVGKPFGRLLTVEL
jgi:sugar lactone lactonase YvrE